MPQIDLGGTPSSLVGLTSLSFGSPAATVGQIRGGTSFQIAALSGATDLNVASVSGGILTLGGTVNSGVRIGTATGSTVDIQVNGATVWRADGTGSFNTVLRLATTIGGTVAGQGAFRSAHGTEGYFRNNANTSDLGFFSLGSTGTDRLDLGIASSGARPGTVGIWSTGAIQLIPSAGSSVSTQGVSITSAGITFGTSLVPIIAWGAVPASSGFLRGPSNTIYFAGRNAANSANITGAQIDGSDILYIGSAAAGARPASIVLDPQTSLLLRYQGTTRMGVEASGTFLNATAGSYGSGTGVTFMGNASVVPSSSPTGGGVLYAEAGALKWRGSSGTVTTLANA